jgi:hypothetical protein
MSSALDTIVPAAREAFLNEQFKGKSNALKVNSPSVSQELKDAFLEAYGAGADAVAAARGVEAAVGNAAEAAAAYADDRAGNLITDIDATTEERVQGIIASGVQAGLSDNEIADQLEPLFGQDRADLIARTEMSTAWNNGVISALKDAGEEYVAVSDGDSDEECANADGEYWTIEEAEANPLEHPNCVRDFRPLTEDELAEVRADEGDDTAAEVTGAEGGEQLGMMQLVIEPERFYSEDELRDERGRWTSGGSSDSAPRVWNGKPVMLKTDLRRGQTGRICEHVIAQHLKEEGFKGIKATNLKDNNFPVDLQAGANVFEVKGGLVSNGETAMHWRATIGQPGPKEALAMSKMSPGRLAAHNAEKMQAILSRKEEVRHQLEVKLGRPVKGWTYGVILNPDRGTADIYKFAGFHSRIAWKSEFGKSGFVKTVKYQRPH